MTTGLYPPSDGLEYGRAYDATTPVVALGDVRLHRRSAQFDAFRLAALSDLPNPNGSAGCSPQLRELFCQLGVPFAIRTELAQDSQTFGHHGGNALDIVAPSTGGGLSGVFAALTPVAALLASAVYLETATNVIRVIWDGHLIAPSGITADMAKLGALCPDTLHVSSSRNRMRAALNSRALRAYFDAPDSFDPTVGPVYTRPPVATSNVQVESVLSRFSSI